MICCAFTTRIVGGLDCLAPRLYTRTGALIVFAA